MAVEVAEIVHHRNVSDRFDKIKGEVFAMTITKQVCCVLLVSWLGLSANSQSALTVCPQGCDFDRIQAAIDAAPPHATILVKSGIYKEALTIRKSLSIKSDPSSPFVIIWSLDDESPAAFIEGDSSITVLLEGFILRATGLYQPPSVLVRGQAHLIGERLQIANSSSSGLQAEDRAQVVLRSSRIFENLWGISAEDSTQITLINSAVFDNRTPGLIASGEGRVHLIMSNVYGNGTEGIYAYGASTVEVIGSAIIKNGGHSLFSGIRLGDQANLTLKESLIAYHGGWGVEVNLRKCGSVFDSYQGGTINIDETNVIVKNDKGDLCLP